MLIEFGQRMVQSKIVFYGCAMSGKSTALKHLYTDLNGKSQLISIETSHQQNKRTLFYDYGTLDLTFGIWRLHLNLWTATGQDFYCATRTTVLQGTDGIIFVADSRRTLLEENSKSWNELKSFFGDKLEKIIPVVVCLNKRDLTDLIPAEDLRTHLKLHTNTQIFETIAIQNHNIYPAFKTLFENIFQIHKTAKVSIMQQLKEYPKRNHS
ncbi:MAG: GTP-binding protein [Candidatus Helarchaeota archaeon]